MKKWINNPWTITLGGAFFGVLLTALIDILKEKPILTTISQVYHWVIGLASTILNFKLSFWIIVLIALGIWIIVKVRTSKPNSIKPAFWNYRSDVFRTLTWKWDYENYSGKWDVVNLRPHCPKCDTPLIPNGDIGYSSLDCPRCNFRSGEKNLEDPKSIKVLVIDNIQKNFS